MGVMVYSFFMDNAGFISSTVGLRIRETLGDIDPLKKVPFKEGHKSG